MASKKGLDKYYDFSKHEASHYDKYDNSYGAIVVAKSYDKVLLVSSGPNNDKYWGFPKGHRNDGENDVGAAIREVKEETGVTIDMGDFILDEKGNPMTFCIEFPWMYSEDVLLYHISKIKEKQKTSPSERPYWNRVGPLKRKITFYLVPVEMDRFKLKPQEEDGVNDVNWFTWEEAFEKMSEKHSNHIQPLVDAFNALQKMKKIGKDKQPLKMSPKLKAEIKARFDKEAKMTGLPMSKWPKEDQPKDWQKVVAEIKGESKHEKEEPKEEPKEQLKEESKHEKEELKEEPKHEKEELKEELKEESKEESDDEPATDETTDDASEESSDDESVKKGGNDVKTKEMTISWVAFVIGVLLVGFVMLMFYLVHSFAFHGGNESVEEGVGTPMA